MIRASGRHAAEFWCKMMHPATTWPIHGRYRCRKCWREYPVPWESGLSETPSQPETERSLAASSPVLFRVLEI